MVPKDKRDEHVGMVVGACLCLVLLVLAFMPVQAMLGAWEGERNMNRQIGGDGFDAWAAAETWGVMAEWGARTRTGIESTQGVGKLLGERIYLLFIWCSLIVYRATSLMLWLLIISPFVIAASADGYYVREIRKDSFVAQSPIRHKAGAIAMKLTAISLAVWLFIPFALPSLLAPMLIALFGLASWLWLSNLQKRI